LSPTDNGKHLSATSAHPAEDTSGVAAENRALQAESQRTLFMDTIDPRFRPSANQPEVIAPALSKIRPQPDPSAGPQPESTVYPKTAQDTRSAPMPQSIFMDNHQAKPYDDYLAGRPNDLPYPLRQPEIYGLRQDFILRERDQQAADNVADMIFPGFGRFQGKSFDHDWRLDYLSSKRCNFKGFGVCFMMNLH
jgi:hypothetical protein